MISKNNAKLIRSLAIKKYRQRYNKYIVEGEKSVLEAIEYRRHDISQLLCTQEFYDKSETALKIIENKLQIITQKQLDTISSLKTNESVIAVLEIPQNADISILKKARFLLYLDGISDPGNLGTIIRTCEWFGVDALICSNDCVDIYNPKVIQATMGSIFRFPVFIIDIEELIYETGHHYKNIYLLEMEGKNLFDTDLLFPMIVIVGNESRGASATAISTTTEKITIPGSKAATESLNAAVAASISIAEIFRRSLTPC